MAHGSVSAYVMYLLLIRCMAVELTVRLVNGNRWFGLLEVLHDGVWSTVCNRGFGQKEVQVVCKMLQIESLHALALSLPPFLMGGDGSRIIFSDLDCDGTETSLAQCKHNGFYNHSCTHYDDISVNCAVDAEYRLAGTRRTRHDMGRLEILVGPLARQTSQGEVTILPRIWSGICGNMYSPISTARVICKQLRHSSSGALLVPGSSFGPRTGFWLTKGNCTGDETSITACVQLVTGYSSSCPTDEIGVICSDSNPGLYILLETTGKDVVYPPFEGSNISLKCEGTKAIHAEATYTWTETAGGRPSGAYLIFGTLTRAHNGLRVKCVVNFYHNGSHEKMSSEPVKLQVYYDILISIASDVNTCQPQTITSNTCFITKGQNVTLVCSAMSYPPPVLFQWSEKEKTTSEQLHIVSANVSRHEGRYNCTVLTKSDDNDSRLPLSASYMFTVIVQEAPDVAEFTANGEDNTTIIVDENSNVSLLCKAAGRPAPIMVLRSDPSSRELSRITQGDLQSSEEGVIHFVLSNIRCQDTGAYRCEAYNSVGQATRTLVILVPCAPRLKDFKRQRSTVQSNVFQSSFTLEVIAFPPPNIKKMEYDGPENDTEGLLEARLHVNCSAKSFAPAVVNCNITVVNVTDDSVYQIVFDNDLGDLPLNFTSKTLDSLDITSISLHFTTDEETGKYHGSIFERSSPTDKPVVSVCVRIITAVWY